MKAFCFDKGELSNAAFFRLLSLYPKPPEGPTGLNGKMTECDCDVLSVSVPSADTQMCTTFPEAAAASRGQVASAWGRRFSKLVVKERKPFADHTLPESGSPAAGIRNCRPQGRHPALQITPPGARSGRKNEFPSSEAALPGWKKGGLSASFPVSFAAVQSRRGWEQPVQWFKERQKKQKALTFFCFASPYRPVHSNPRAPFSGWLC